MTNEGKWDFSGLIPHPFFKTLKAADTMQIELPELNSLLSEVEKTYGKDVATSTDFDELSTAIYREINEPVSSSTLKRLWGYVTSHPVPRKSTLDILSRYVGYRNFTDYCKCLTLTGNVESGFFTSRFVSVSELEIDQAVVVGWNPNRIVTVQYLGDFHFRVIKSENSQLQIGDEFETTNFSVGFPLYLSYILRNGEKLPSYIAGSIGGLTVLELL